MYKIISILLLISNCIYAQPELDALRDNAWIVGSNCFDPMDSLWHKTKIEFRLDSFKTSHVCNALDIAQTNASICDSRGHLFCYCNGWLMMDSSGHVMQGTTGTMSVGYPINQGWSGRPIIQNVLILPMPGDTNRFVAFSLNVFNDGIDIIGIDLYRHIINKNGNNGLGEFESYNEPIAGDYFNWGEITACRHANGRDWWIVIPNYNINSHRVFLLDPYGFHDYGHQVGGIAMEPGIGPGIFSPDGNKYVYVGGFSIYTPAKAYIYDFDRCTGTLSNQKVVLCRSLTIPYLGQGGAISPNSRYLYVCPNYVLYQIDLLAADPQAAVDTIALYDGFASALFKNAQLAPNGKIYITTAGQTQYLHVINSPDSAGAACGFVQHGVQLPTIINFGLPNYPNFRLGPIDGSSCDTLGINAVSSPVVQHSEPSQSSISIAPNPASSYTAVSFSSPLHEGGVLTLSDMQGRVVQRHSVQRHAIAFGLDVSGLATGVYSVSVYDRKTGVVRGVQLVVEH
jgi:Secretion system C-terminal sorting domain